MRFKYRVRMCEYGRGGRLHRVNRPCDIIGHRGLRIRVRYGNGAIDLVPRRAVQRRY